MVVKKPKSWDLARRTTKMGLPNIPGAVQGIDVLRATPDIDVLGAYTVRPEWLRGGQTDRQIRRRGTPLEQVTHTANSPKEKINALLRDAHRLAVMRHLDENRLGWDNMAELTQRPHGIKQIVLIDDSVSRVVAGAVELAKEKPHARPFMEIFTLAAFSFKPHEELEALTVPGIVNVVSMHGWADVSRMLDQVM